MAQKHCRKFQSRVHERYRQIDDRRTDDRRTDDDIIARSHSLKTIFCRHYRSTFHHGDVISAFKTIDFGEVIQNKGYYAAQGHLRSPMSVPVERPYVTSY